MTTLANMGLPMIAVIWAPAWYLFLPIVLVEALAARRILNVNYETGLGIAGAANLASTLVALPVTWFLMVLLGQLVPYQSPETPAGILTTVTAHSAWLAPYLGRQYWIVVAAIMVLCVPFFFASVGTEYLVAKWILPRTEPSRQIGRWAWIANGFSYGGILVALGILLSHYARHPRPQI